jgi:hypothetical protein
MQFNHREHRDPGAAPTAKYKIEPRMTPMPRIRENESDFEFIRVIGVIRGQASSRTNKKFNTSSTEEITENRRLSSL